MRKHYIYILKCPITNDIRYVGQSVNPKVRYRRHISESKRRNDHKCNWVKSLLDKNKKPILEIVKECNSDEINYWEKYFIDEYNKTYDLTNIREGGDYYQISEETKEKIRKTLKGRKPPKQAAIAFKEYKSIKIECYKDGELIGTFESIKECSEKLNLNRPKISMVLNGLRPHHKGFTFKAV